MVKQLSALFVGACCIIASTAVRGAAVQPTDTGLVIDAGIMGSSTLEYPRLLGKDDKVARKLIEKVVVGEKVTLKYEGGGEINVQVGDGGNVTLTLDAIPADVVQYSCEMRLDIGLAGDGNWSVDSKPEQAFPREKAAKPQLFQGHAKSMVFGESEGDHVSVTCPDFSYVTLQDNRAWNWPIFMLRVNVPITGISTQHFILTAQAPAVIQKKVDQFGQPIRLDYPGKVKTLDELKSDVASEKTYFSSMHPPTLDAFGGMPNSGAKLGLSKSGFFHVEKKKNHWFMVDPAGNAFFQLAACAFCPVSYTYVTGREQIYEWIPPTAGEYQSAWKPGYPGAFSFVLANQIRKYNEPVTLDSWFNRMIDRARAMGLNSVGAFSTLDEKIFAAKTFPYVAGLPTNEWDHLPRITGVHETWDPFDKANQEQYRKNCAALAADANDPQLIGYFLVNEPIYEDIPKVVPMLPGKWACKRELVKMLEEKYKTTDALNAAWNMTATSFDELNDRGLAVTTKSASEDVQAFTGLFFETYFKLIVDGFKQYDKNHMLLGNRLQPGTANNEQLCQICGKYVDIFSVNYYTSYLDPTFLDRLEKWSGGKPILLSEFDFTSASDTGLGGGGVKDQQERGLAYRTYVEKAATLPYVVGIEWYTWTDQSMTGQWFSKYNGEAFNTGLFSVADRPYRKMIDEIVKTNDDIYKVQFGERTPYVYDNPKFSQSSAGSGEISISHAPGSITIDGSANGWPGVPPERIAGSRLVNGADAGGVEASFKMCWDEQNLYFLSHITDSTPMKNAASGGQLWHGDGVELFVGEDPDRQGPLLFNDRHILLGAGSPAGASFISGSTAKCKTAVVRDPDGKGYTLEAAVPFSTLGFVPKEGQQIRLDIAIDDSADGEMRSRQLMWNGTERNSSDRTGWGKAVLTH